MSAGGAFPSASDVDLAGVRARLLAAGVPCEVLAVGPAAHVVVSSWGGRVYGPFFEEGPAEGWLPAAFDDDASFRALVASGDWNVGGDRTWIGPEIAYMIRDRSDYWGSYVMPPSLDPGRHVLSRSGDEVVLDRAVELDSATPPVGAARVDLQLRVRPAAHPFRHLRGASAPAVGDLRFGGYVTEVQLALASEGAQEAESWVLAQVRGGGTAFVAAVPDAQVTDYYEPVGDALHRVDGGVAVELTGDRRFKIGLAAPHVTGRLGHVRALSGGEAVLFVRSSPVDASAEYSEEPDPSPGVRGDALHLYDDDGGLGGFAEVEARGTPVTGPRPRPVTDRFVSWWFRGPADQVALAAQHLLGVPAATVAAALTVGPDPNSPPRTS